MLLKRYLILFSFLIASAIMAVAKPYVLVIDAGHGGHDAGAVGSFSKEKNINLKVALAFGKYVEQNMPNVKVIYTRKTDVFVELKERARIANKNHADIFISIHTNSVPKGAVARGIETYTMGLRRSNEKFSAALKENEVITYEKDYKEKYNGYDPKSPESLIMFELMHDSNMEESVSLASHIQNNICAEAGRQSKGVKQDVFLVLRETSMPACLVELGFISTPDEEEFLNTEDGIQRLALGIYKGFAQYSKQGRTNVSYQPSASSNSNATSPEVAPASQKQPQPSQKPAQTTAQKPTQTSEAKRKPTQTSSQNPSNTKPNAQNTKQNTQNTKPNAQNTKPNTQNSKPQAQNPPKQATQNTKPQDQKSSKVEPNPNAPNIYKVVILAFDTQRKTGDACFKGHKDVKFFKEEGRYKYYIGEFKNKQDAFNLRAELVKDFPQCFVITTKDGIRIK